MPKLTDKQKKEIFRAATLMTQIAFTAIACVLLGIFLGRFLDNRLGTSPLFIIIFSLLGCVTAIKAMIDLVKNLVE